MKKLVIATNNLHKVEEIKSKLGNHFNFLTLKDIGCFDEIPEDHETLEENAIQKARYIFNKYGLDCIADDTGLEVEALNGRPGVYSARYSEKDSPNLPKELRAKANVEKLLSELKNHENRKAAFKTIICLIENGKEQCFEGKVDGAIINEIKGDMGFGYDPVFCPEGYAITFAQMPLDEKNKISHRGRALDKLASYLLNSFNHNN